MISPWLHMQGSRLRSGSGCLQGLGSFLVGRAKPETILVFGANDTSTCNFSLKKCMYVYKVSSLQFINKKKRRKNPSQVSLE